MMTNRDGLNLLRVPDKFKDYFGNVAFASVIFNYQAYLLITFSKYLNAFTKVHLAYSKVDTSRSKPGISP